MKIRSIMTTKVVTVSMDDPLKVIIEIFSHARFHHLLVVERDRLRGVISDRDVLKTTSPFLHTISERPRDLAILNKRAHQIMTREPVTITVDTTLEEAINLLLHENVSCLPVLSEDGRIEGIVTWKDLIRAHLHG